MTHLVSRSFSSTLVAKCLSISALAFALLQMAACGGSNPSESSPVGPKTLISIEVTAASYSIGVGATDQFKATGTYSDKSSQDLTTGVTWSSSSAANATISKGGVVTAVAVGTTNITASSTPVTSTPVSLTVTPPTLQSIQINADSSVKVGGKEQFTPVGTYSDNSGGDLPYNSVTWASSNTAIATISTTGVATGVAAGTTNITASSGSVTSPPFSLTVPSILSIAILPNPASLTPGQVQQFMATGTYSDSSTGDITSCAIWTSSSPATATISSAGLATGVAVGTTQITASSGTLSSPSVSLTVSTTGPPPPTELLYATANNAILGFTVDTTTGALSTATFTPSTSLPCGGAASSSLGLVTPPKLGLLYVSDRQDNQVGGSVYGNIVFNNQVEGFAIGNGTGSLTPLSGSPFALPLVEPYGFPVGMATDPQGKFLYVANVGDIDELAINSTTGALTAISGSPVRGVANGDYLTIDPSGLFLFADGLNGISALAVDANTGALTEVAGSPFSLPAINFAGQSPSALVVDSTGTFLYVVVYDPQEGGAPELSYVAGYSIDATSGALTQVPNTPFFGNTPNSGLSGGIGTAGGFLYAGSGMGIYGFSIAPGTGVLTQISGSPFAAGIAPLSLTATSDGRFLYAAFNQIYVFAIDPTTGALSAVGNPVPAASAPFLLTLYNP